MIESTMWGNTRLALVSPNELTPIEFSRVRAPSCEKIKNAYHRPGLVGAPSCEGGTSSYSPRSTVNTRLMTQSPCCKRYKKTTFVTKNMYEIYMSKYKFTKIYSNRALFTN